MVDDSHAVGFIGARGAGTPEHCGVEGRVHLLSGTFGKALGGASGGYIAGPKPFVDLLRQRARPYLFSNALAPSITAATIEALDLVATSADLRDNLARNAAHFRKGLSAVGYQLTPGEHPIIPVMIGDAAAAARLAGRIAAARRLCHGVFLSGRAAWQGAYQDADERRPFLRRSRPRHRRIRRGGPRRRRSSSEPLLILRNPS